MKYREIDLRIANVPHYTHDLHSREIFVDPMEVGSEYPPLAATTAQDLLAHTCYNWHQTQRGCETSLAGIIPGNRWLTCIFLGARNKRNCLPLLSRPKQIPFSAPGLTVPSTSFSHSIKTFPLPSQSKSSHIHQGHKPFQLTFLQGSRRALHLHIHCIRSPLCRIWYHQGYPHQQRRTVAYWRGMEHRGVL